MEHKQQSDFGIIVSARLGSSRLPGKALKPLMGQPMIMLLLRRLAGFGQQQLIVATTALPEDDALTDLITKHGYTVFRGSQNDVALRLIQAAQTYHFKYVVRVTGDCPFVDTQLVQQAIGEAIKQPFDLMTTKGVYPQGLDCEIFETETLKSLHQTNQLTSYDKEHVTAYYYQHKDKFQIHQVPLNEDYDCEDLIWTIDTPEDYQRLNELTKGITDTGVHVKDVYKDVYKVMS